MKKLIKLNKEDLSKIICEVVRTVYHGTPFRSSAEGIMRDGLGAAKEVRFNGGLGLPSGEGRQYLTSSPGNAARYAIMNDEEPEGYVFQFDIDDSDESFGADEDELGSIIYKYFNGTLPGELPFRKELLGYFNNDELDSIKRGEFSGFSTAKKIQDKLTNKERQAVLAMVNNLTTKSVIKPTQVWAINKPDEEEKKALMTARDFGPFDEFFKTHSKELKK